MNIAFTTILLFIILAPGFIARHIYHSSKLSVKDPNKNIVTELTLSIIPAFFIQISGIAITNNFSTYYIDFNILGNLLLGVNSSQTIKMTFNNIGTFKYQIFFYNLIIFSSAIALGYLSRKIVRYFKLDRKYRYLRFTNKWHYIFTGECLDFPDIPDEYEDITNKIINVLCKVNDKTILYTGQFFNYYIDSAGNLEAVHLKYPIRRMLEDDREIDNKKKYFQIESRYLVIPNKDILNINFRYFNLEEVEADDLTPQEKHSAINLV